MYETHDTVINIQHYFHDPGPQTSTSSSSLSNSQPHIQLCNNSTHDPTQIHIDPSQLLFKQNNMYSSDDMYVCFVIDHI